MEILIAVAAGSIFSSAVFILAAVSDSGAVNKTIVIVSEITVTAFIALFPIIFKKFEALSYAVSVAIALAEAAVYVFVAFRLRRGTAKKR